MTKKESFGNATFSWAYSLFLWAYSGFW